MSDVLKFDELNKLYELSDETINLLNNKAAKRFMKARSNIVREEFEELVVYRILKELYEDLMADNKKAFLDLAKQCYKAATPHGKNTLTSGWIQEILENPCPTTHYVYENEAERKRDKAVESVNSVTGKQAKLAQLDLAIRYWAAQTRYYSDYIAEQSTLKAYEDGNVAKVQWITQRDGKVCETCRERDKKVYLLLSAPAKPHVNCRCLLIPYLK